MAEKKLVDPNKLCMGCMKIKERPSEPCPFCGFDMRTYQIAHNSLAPYEILNGKYLVGRVIGKGGFGMTYIGWDFYQSKRVCIKEYFPRGIAARVSDTSMISIDLHHTTNTEIAQTAYLSGLQNYLQEAANLSVFYDLPGIVSVRDFFYGNNTAYIVMEYIEGVHLKQYAKQFGGKYTPEQLLPLMRNVIASLGVIHRANIIHRDISPDNIMISQDQNVKVIDFGAATMYNGAGENSVVLKHGYAPIEQYDKNGNQGPWTDIYSLCATMYYLLSGVKLQKSVERQEHEHVRCLQAVGVPIGEELDAAIMKGLGIEIPDRYESMEQLYAALYGAAKPEESQESRRSALEIAKSMIQENETNT